MGYTKTITKTSLRRSSRLQERELRRQVQTQAKPSRIKFVGQYSAEAWVEAEKRRQEQQQAKNEEQQQVRDQKKPITHLKLVNYPKRRLGIKLVGRWGPEHITATMIEEAIKDSHHLVKPKIKVVGIYENLSPFVHRRAKEEIRLGNLRHYYREQRMKENRSCSKYLVVFYENTGDKLHSISDMEIGTYEYLDNYDEEEPDLNKYINSSACFYVNAAFQFTWICD